MSTIDKNQQANQLNELENLPKERLRQEFYTTVRKPSCLNLDNIPGEAMKVAVLNKKLTESGLLWDRSNLPVLKKNSFIYI